MASKLLVVLQFAAIAALFWPWRSDGWNAWSALPIALALAIGGWAIASNPPRNFSIFPVPRANASLVTTGPYAHVRHPMYVALMVFALGFCAGWSTPVHWLAAFALALILGVKSRREERFLRARFPDYEAYAARTPAFLPRLRNAAR